MDHAGLVQRGGICVGAQGFRADAFRFSATDALDKTEIFLITAMIAFLNGLPFALSQA
jgi:hypothetical protein